MAEDSATAYLIFLMPDAGPPICADQYIRLGYGLYICVSPISRSRLYHAIKAHYQPESLLVAALADDPKFKGMSDGALSELRRLRRAGLWTSAPATDPEGSATKLSDARTLPSTDVTRAPSRQIFAEDRRKF